MADTRAASDGGGAPGPGASSPRRLGLALSGGAARGAAHAGVLHVLREEGIDVHCIAGTSAGAIVGAFYAARVPLSRQLEFAQALRWRSVRMLGFPKLGFFQPGEMERYLGEILGEARIESLPIPFAVVATDFRSATSVVYRQGSLVHALTASSAIPVIFSPVLEGDAVLVDGGVSNNLPTGVCRSLGADIVLAVNVVPDFRGDRRFRNLFEVAMATFDLLCLHSTKPGMEEADLCIQPEVARFHPADLERSEEMVARGAVAMRRGLPKLRRLLGD
jgi:NTE family protein